MEVSVIDQIEAEAVAKGVDIIAALDAASISRVTWWRWKSDRYEPRAGTLRKLREAISAAANPPTKSKKKAKA